MKKKTMIARAANAAGIAILAAPLFLGTQAMAQGQNKPATAGVPAPKILVINREAILRFSKVGQDIARQVQSYTQAAENEFKGQGESLRKQGASLQQQLAILAPDVKAKKIADFEGKERSLQAKVQQRQTLIQGGVIKARQQVEAALGPIIQGIMNERGGNLLLDRSAVVWGSGDVDITKTAIDRLNQKLATVKVELVAPPAGTQGG